MKAKMRTTLALATMFMFNSVVKAQNIWNDINTETQTQVQNTKPFVTYLVGVLIAIGIIIGGLILIFGGENKGRKAGIWAGGFFAGSILVYVATKLLY